MKRAAWLFVALSTGCVHSHFQRDAPGHVDLSKPPTNPESRTVESPRDPGERMIVTSVGPFAGLGVDSGDGSFASTLGAEASVHYGTTDSSHAEDDFLVYPQRAVGLNVGGNLLTRVNGNGRGPSRGYAELQLFEIPFGIAGGWAWDPGLSKNGPQATAFMGPWYLRSTTLLGGSTDVELGIVIKLPAVWVWSR
jgi:hypothetical protein